MTGRHDYPELVEKPPAYWLDKSWVYIPAAAHGDSQSFAERQRQRMQQAQQHREKK